MKQTPALQAESQKLLTQLKGFMKMGDRMSFLNVYIPACSAAFPVVPLP